MLNHIIIKLLLFKMVDKSKIPKDLSKLCLFCFDTLNSFLNKTSQIIDFPKEFKEIESPLFVTWTTGKEDDLRGCIGTFEKGLLEKNLPKYALISSLKDSRFSPVKKEELPKLSVAVSLLVDFEDAKDVYDWEVGIHGIEIFYENYSATFLPEVAPEQGWDKKTTLVSLLKKSGCRSKLSQIEKDIRLIRYKSYKTKLSYDDYSKLI